jgi:hypothetical protein
MARMKKRYASAEFVNEPPKQDKMEGAKQCIFSVYNTWVSSLVEEIILSFKFLISL